MACVMWNASDGAGLSGSSGAVGTQVAQTVWSSRGRGGDVIPAPGREKTSKTREDVLSILPFSLAPNRPAPLHGIKFPHTNRCDCALAQGRQSRLSGPIRLEAGLQGPAHWNR